MTAQLPLIEGNYYHIYNRGNNGETIFRSAENYRYFLQLFTHHIEPVASTFAFCLLPNHFHFLNYIRTAEEQKGWLLAQGRPLAEDWQPYPPSRAFKNLFIAYSMAFSIRFGRTGSLFQKPFKRRLVDSDRYFTALVRYIHRNPQTHRLMGDFRQWPWSSYALILEERPTRLLRDDVLAWFGGRAPFVALHQTDPNEQVIAAYVTDEDDSIIR